MFDNENNITQTPDFSDIPALGDTQGLETFLNNEMLAAQGLQPQETPAAQPAQPADPAAITPATPAPAAGGGGDTITLTREQLNAILASRGQAPAATNPAQARPATPVQTRNSGYSAQDQAFIVKALQQGYSLEQINNFLVQQRGQAGRIDPVLEQRLAQVEQYLKEQEYTQAETAFINKLSDFGNKWGLSEQDLVTFGNAALQKGINIAVGNIDLETVFRAVYPKQYAIRSRRMTPTNSSQIYGGTNIPEGSRANAARAEDAYVEAFLKGAMPNQYGMLNKK
jgi:hypothetical protein